MQANDSCFFLFCVNPSFFGCYLYFFQLNVIFSLIVISIHLSFVAFISWFTNWSICMCVVCLHLTQVFDDHRRMMSNYPNVVLVCVPYAVATNTTHTLPSPPPPGGIMFQNLILDHRDFAFLY